MTFGEKIKEARLAMNLSQTELAQMTGISERSLYTYEQLGTLPRKSNIRKLAEALHISVSYLLDESETDSQSHIDQDMFILEAKENFGSKGAKEAQEVLGRVNSLFAGGELDEDAKDVFFQAIMSVYMDSKKTAREKYTPKKYRKQMKTAEHIIETVDKLVRKYHTRDPYELCQLLGIKIHYYDLQKKLKGFFYYQSRQKNIVIDHNVNGILERILVAHELGHAVLHTKIAMMHGFQEMEVFDDRSIEENEANFFAAELLLEDGEVLECLSEHTFFETAKMLYVPAALLDYKFSLLHEKGELVNSMYIRKADFLKEDLHAYDNDIGYGDI